MKLSRRQALTVLAGSVAASLVPNLHIPTALAQATPAAPAAAPPVTSANYPPGFEI